jgi:hypothetical protein
MLVAVPRPSRSFWFAAAYVGLAVWLVFRVAQSYGASTGFTSLIAFGDRHEATRIAAVDSVPVHTYQESYGYDGQFYAQIAVAGNPFDPGLQRALDLPAYRTRRILLPLVTHVVGLGRPGWILTAYALANVACWLALAWLLARWWFPPGRLHDLLRWVGSLFGAGMLVSVCRSLTDAPALLLIAAGVRSIEVNRARLAAGFLAAAGLVREASVVAAAAFGWPSRAAGRPPAKTLLLASIAVLPAAVWTVVVAAHFQTVKATSLGAPFTGLSAGLAHIGSTARTAGILAARNDVLVVAAFLVQAGLLVFLTRRRPAHPWWRVAVAVTILIFLTDRDPWADLFSTISRATLPLTLAFNVLVPRSRAGLVVLLAGNLTVPLAPSLLGIVETDPGARVEGIACVYASGFHKSETDGTRSWRWSRGSATLRIENHLSAAARATLEFDVDSATNRTVSVQAGALRQTVALEPRRRVHVRVGPILVPPGSAVVRITTSEPPWIEPGGDHRALAFSVGDLRLAL